VRTVAAAISGLFLFASALGAISVAAASADDPASIRIKLERGPCYGTCPVYSVELSGDGTVTYNGKQFVLVKGQHASRIAPAAVSALLDKVRAADFWSLQPRYAARITDNPEYSVTVTAGGRTKSVTDYVGREAGMPANVTALEEEIDRVAGTKRWVTGNTETLPLLRDEHFNFRSEEAIEMLSFCVKKENTEMIQAFTDAGTMDSQRGKDAALLSAATTNDPNLVARMLIYGANPNAQNDRGWTALMLAERRGFGLLDPAGYQAKGAEIITMLMASGADPNLQNQEGDAALHLVEHADDIPLLIKAGSKLEQRNAASETPLLRVADQDVALALIAAGADMDARDKNGHGLADKAHTFVWHEVAEMEAKHRAH